MTLISPYLLIPAAWQASPGSTLFCFPYAGGSPYLFLNWRAGLQPHVTVAALQVPGRGMRFLEQPYLSISEVVAEIMEGLPDLRGRSFAFYGHSMGSIIAFELARALRRAGKPQPSHLFVGAARPPQIGPMLPHLHQLADDAFVAALQSRYGGIPAEILNDREALSLFLPALRADFTAYETYGFAPESPLACPIIGFAGETDGVASRRDVEGWQEHTGEWFELNSIPGGHFFLEESRDLLLAAVRRHLIP